MFHHDLSGVRTQLHDLFFEGVTNSLSMAFAQQVLDRFTELNYIFQKLDPDSVIRPMPQQYAASIPRKEVSSRSSRLSRRSPRRRSQTHRFRLRQW